MEVKHMVACCCSHGYRRFECLECEKNRRTAADGIPRRITAEGKIMKLDWELPQDAIVDDISGEALEEHIRRLLDAADSTDGT